MPADKLNILMLGGAKRVSIGRMLIEAGHKCGVEVQLYAYELSADLAISSIADVIVGKRWDDVDLMDHLSAVVDRYDIRVVIPFVDQAVSVAARLIARIPSLTGPVCDADNATLWLDKLASQDKFVEFGLNPPLIACDIDPAIAKPRFGSASKGIMIFDSYRNVPAAIVDSDDYVVQRYIASRQEITVDCFVDSLRQTKVVSPRLRLEVSGGEVVRSVTCSDAQVEQLSRVFLEKSRITGAVTLQFLRHCGDDRSDLPMIMEVNPRLGGGVVCSIHAGADIPLMIVKEALGQSVDEAKAADGVEIARYPQEVVVKGGDR